MADSKWCEQKKAHIKAKTKSYLPRRKASKAERTFQESAWKPSWNHRTNLSKKKIINCQLNVKLGQFMEEKLDALLRKIKNRKVAGLNEIPSEVWKIRKFDDLLLWLGNTVYKQNTIEKWTKDCILFFHKKTNSRIIKNYRSITLININGKIYYALLLNHIQPKNWEIS